MPKFVNYLKVRGSYAEVGNTVPPYVTYELSHPGVGSEAIATQDYPFGTLHPENTKSWEFGLDFRMLADRLTGTFTWYKTNTYNQFITVTPTATSGKQNGFVNAGNIQNQGVEFMLGYDMIKQRHFTWNTNFNGSANVNKIVEVDPKDGLSQIVLTSSANNSYESILATGKSYGDVWGSTLTTNKAGQVVFGPNSSGQLVPTASSAFVDLGNPNPKFQLGWANGFTLNHFVFNFLVDGKFGGNVLSMTQAMMDSYGVSQVTGQARDAGGVKVNGIISNSGGSNDGQALTTADAQAWYTTVGGRAGVAGVYMYSATVIRLREADLGYNFPITAGSPVKSLRLSLTGRNLIYFLKHAPYDPEQTMSTGNGLSGVDTFTQPATRNFGLSLNVGL
jgi:outer membrane receptor protein involved in Fe transport